MKILVVQTAFLGDLVLSTPVFDALKELYPESTFSLLTTKLGKELFGEDRRFDQVLSLEKKRGIGGAKEILAARQLLRTESFDIVYSLHRSFRTALLLHQSKISKRIGFRDANGSFLYSELAEKASERHAAERFLSLLTPEWKRQGKPVELLYDRPLRLEVSMECSSDLRDSYVLVPGSAWRTKQWHWTEYKKLAHLLAREGRKVVLAGSGGERDLCEQIREDSSAILNTAGELSLPQFVALVAASRGLVCNDSFALHVGSATQVPTVAIFCATSPSFGFGPWKNERALVVEKAGLWCKPCRRHGSQQCPTGTEWCMRGVSAGEVLEALFQVTGESPLYSEYSGLNSACSGLQVVSS